MLDSLHGLILYGIVIWSSDGSEGQIDRKRGIGPF
jgi:hypothetical protein